MRFAKAFLAVSILCLAGIALADNLVSNPDFETGDLTDWLVFGQSADSDAVVQAGDNGPSAPGNYSVLMENYGEAIALLLKQSTPAGSGIAGNVDYSFDLKLDQADVGGVLFVNIFAESEGGGVIGGSGLLGPLWPWNEWTTYTGSFVAPAGTDFLTIQIEAVTGADPNSSCVVHADNVVLDQGTVDADDASWGQVKSLFR